MLERLRQEIEQELERYLRCNPALSYASLFEAARYSLLARGKRLRPLLLASTASSYGAPLSAILPAACAIEMIHTYSLIHDDLPCMDDDDFRRGLPTLHKIYPEWHALLAGDFLLTYAFEILSTAEHLGSEQKIALISTLARNSGAHGMIGGQMIDLLSEGIEIDAGMLEEMHSLKTGALITGSLVCGAIIGNAPPSDIEYLKRAGSEIGFAFQLIDDALDSEGNSIEMGKSSGSDANNQKATGVTLLGVEHTKLKAEKLHASAEKTLSQLSIPIPLLETLFEQMIYRRK